MYKKVIIIVLIIALLLVAFFAIKSLFKKKVTIKNIKSLHYSYSTGTMIYSKVMYDLEYQDDKYILKIKPDQVPDEETITVELDNNTVEKIEEALNDYSVSDWDGFSKSDLNVLDGNSFSFSISFDDDKRISASGYMMYPKNYREVKSLLESIFNSFLNE